MTFTGREGYSSAFAAGGVIVTKLARETRAAKYRTRAMHFFPNLTASAPWRLSWAACSPVNYVNPAPEAIVRGCHRMSACHPLCAALSLDRSRLEAIPANKGLFVRDNRRLSGRRAVRGGRIIREGGGARQRGGWTRCVL